MRAYVMTTGGGVWPAHLGASLAHDRGKADGHGALVRSHHRHHRSSVSLGVAPGLALESVVKGR